MGAKTNLKELSKVDVETYFWIEFGKSLVFPPAAWFFKTTQM